MASSILPTSSEEFTPVPAASSFIPPLENGDRLTRAEFERRYEAMPNVRKAELIEGEVHMPSPVRITKHGQPQFDFKGLLWVYKVYTPGVAGGDNATVRMDMENEPQPDGLLYVEPAFGGKIRIDDDDIINGSPELAAEIASSSASIDRSKKFRVYRRNEVQEYVVWRVLDRAVDWFCLQEGDFQRLAPNAAGVYQSRVFPGLWIDVPAILHGDFAQAIAVLQQGIHSPDHADFVAQLAAAQQKNKPTG